MGGSLRPFPQLPGVGVSRAGLGAQLLTPRLSGVVPSSAIVQP